MKRAAKVAKWIGFCALVGALNAVVWIGAWWAKQPRHAGKTVHQWYAEACHFFRHYNKAKGKEVQLAFELMSSNAVPFLLSEMSAVPRLPGFRERFFSRLQESRVVPKRVKWLLPPAMPFQNNKWVAVKVLKSMGPAAISAQPELERLLSQTNAPNRHQALDLLNAFGLKASNSAPVVADLLSQTNLSLNYSALLTFSAITPPKSPHAARLTEAIERGHIRAAPGLRVLAKLEVDYMSLVPKLGAELCSTDSTLHSEARATCLGLGLHREVLFPRLAEAMKVPEPRFRSQLLGDVRGLGEEGIVTLDTVLAALDDSYSYVRAEAAKTLAALNPSGEKARVVLEALASKRNDPNEYVAESVRAAIKALEQNQTSLR